ncbi:cellulase family glycosylhydrolase, partial [bacterium]|nr:cellulase family glycosylhydrolase [bacterium]
MKRILALLCIAFSLNAWADFEHFITRDGDKLMDGAREFRFISFNIPNLHYVEDDLRFDRKMPFRFPDDYEINDALQSIAQMGGQIVRTYTLPVYKPSEPQGTPKYVLGPGQFNEDAFKTLDRVLAAANQNNIRLIIPVVNNFQWWGGAQDYAAFRDKQKDDFWTDPQLIDDFKQTVHFLLTRVNTVTGVAYKDDKAVLAWETGNETQCPHSWTKEIAAYMKSLDSNHLVCDGYYTSVLRDESINDPNVDIVQTHHYENDAREMVDHIWQSAKKARGKKPYMLGEFGFISTEATRAVLDVTIKEGISGALIWSLRHHHREGGFFWHSEPSGGDFFKAYHWPGFPSGEIYDEA